MADNDRAVNPKVWIALISAWLLPGAGHLLLGRVRRGLLFAAIVWLCFGLGLAHAGRLALKDPRQPFLTTLQVVANLGVGPADLIARVKVYGAPAYRAYGQERISERHRHRYELNPEYRDRLEEAGLVIAGTSPDGKLVEVVEVEDHPWFVASQFHPEFASTPFHPHPLFVAYIAAAKRNKNRGS